MRTFIPGPVEDGKNYNEKISEVSGIVDGGNKRGPKIILMFAYSKFLGDSGN